MSHAIPPDALLLGPGYAGLVAWIANVEPPSYGEREGEDAGYAGDTGAERRASGG